MKEYSFLEEQEHDEEVEREWQEALSRQAEAEANVRYPICPLNLYFEGDDIDTNKCDYDIEIRTCFMGCKGGIG